MQTRLTLIVTAGVGHDPVRASGLLLTHLPGICRRTDPRRAQLWRLSTSDLRHTEPWEQFQRVAEHQNRAAAELRAEHWLDEAEFAADPLADAAE